MVVRPGRLCIALLGTALSLINFGIDEFVNPRLRTATGSSRKVRMRVGFTPVARTAAPRFTPVARTTASAAPGPAEEPESPGTPSKEHSA